MKNLTITTSVALLLIVPCSYAQQDQLPKAFYKGCLVSSLSRGPSRTLYTTYSNDGKLVKSDIAQGAIDPFIMEYGLKDKLGIGFSRGGENYSVNVNDYYKAEMPEGRQLMNVSTKYLTFDFSYHPYTTKRLDVSLFTGTGFFRISGTMDNIHNNSNFCGQTPDKLFSYNAHGAVIRAGIRSRFYFSKRFGFMAMIYGFNGYVKEKQKPNPVSDQKNNSGYATMLTGRGLEFGICFRIFKQKNVIKETNQIVQTKEAENIGVNSANVSGLFGGDSY